MHQILNHAVAYEVEMYLHRVYHFVPLNLAICILLIASPERGHRVEDVACGIHTAWHERAQRSAISLHTSQLAIFDLFPTILAAEWVAASEKLMSQELNTIDTVNNFFFFFYCKN